MSAIASAAERESASKDTLIDTRTGYGGTEASETPAAAGIRLASARLAWRADRLCAVVNRYELAQYWRFLVIVATPC